MTYKPNSYPREIPSFRVKGRGEITVSAKGIVNGLSNIPNDGADFGPDTMLGATAPGQYGSPYTETGGIMEAKEALPKIKNLSSLRLVSSGAILIKFGGLPIKTTAPIIIFDDEFVELVSHDGLTEPVQPPNTPIVYIQNTTAGSSTTSTGDVIHRTRNPNVSPSAANNLGNGIIKIDGITLFKSNEGNLLNSYGYYDSAGTEIYGVPNYSQLYIGKIGLYDSTYGNILANITTNGNDDLIHIGKLIGVGGTSNRNSMLGTNVNHFYAEVVFLLSYASAAPSGSGYSAMLSLNPGLECHFGILDLFGYNNGAYPNGSFVINNSSAGGYVTIDVLGDEMGGNASKSYFGNYGFFLQISKPNYLFINNYNLGGPSSVFVNGYGLSNVFIRNYNTMNLAGNAPFTKTPTLSANPPVSGTVYQNTNPYDIEISVPISYPTTASTASSGYLRIGTSPTAGANPIFDEIAAPATEVTVNGRTVSLKARVPAGQYYEVDVTTASIGTAVVMAV